MLGFGLLTAIMIRPVLAYALIFGPSALSTVSMLLFAAYIANICKPTCEYDGIALTVCRRHLSFGGRAPTQRLRRGQIYFELLPSGPKSNT